MGEGSSILTLEQLAERLERNTVKTIAALESQARRTNELAEVRRHNEAHTRFLEAALDNSGEITGKSVGERAAQRKHQVKENEVTISYLEQISIQEGVLVRTSADLDGYRVERQELQSQLRIRELYDTAQRALVRQRRNKPWRNRRRP